MQTYFSVTTDALLKPAVRKIGLFGQIVQYWDFCTDLCTFVSIYLMSVCSLYKEFLFCIYVFVDIYVTTYE